tara:strand:+ start:1194 stop:3017 length:1824 start_codon:yes stop_codon:yes gene_type:complete
MRILNKKWIGIGLAILFAASLFALGGSSRYSNLFNSDNFVADVSGTKISTTQFIRALDMNIGQFAQMIGNELSGEQIRAFQIHQLVLQNLVNNAIFENEFDKINFFLDETIIAQKTKERFPNLYNKNKINDDALNSFLRQQRLKIEDLVNIINFETRSVVFDDLFFLIDYPMQLSKIINMVNKQKRKVSLIRLPYDEIVVPNLNIKNISETNEDLIKFYEDNVENYMDEERRDLSYVLLDKSIYKKNFIPSEDEIKKYFFENKDLFLIPEKRSFKQFNFKSHEEAENFRIQINGLNSNEIIKKAVDNNLIYNEFKDLEKNQVLGELSDEIFSLNENNISNVVKTTLAFHVIFLDKINLERMSSYAEVKDEIESNLTNIHLDNFFSELKSKINQDILGGQTLDEIAQNNNLKLNKLKNTTINIKMKDDLLTSIKNKGFTQNKDFVSDISNFDENTSFIVNVYNVIPSKPKTLKNSFNDIKSDFIISKKIDYVKDSFDKNNFENSIKYFEDTFNMPIKIELLDSNSDFLPKALINSIFNTDVNNLTFSSDDEYIYLVEINNIIIREINENISELSMISELKNAFGNEIIRTKKITLNDELINGLLSQYK